MAPISAIIMGYLLGSVNGAQFLHHVMRPWFPQHVTRVGLKTAGLTNFWLYIAKFPAIFVFLIDVGKGFTAIYLARVLGLADPLSLLAGIAAIAGHNWPVYFHFRGGRGVATLIGSFLAYDFQTTALGLLLVFLPLSIIRWSGLAPFGLIAAMTVLHFSLYGFLMVLVAALAALVLLARRLHAERNVLSTSKRKMWVLKNIVWYDRSGANPPPLKKILSLRRLKT